ncbi:Type II secretion system protein F [bioreactor metagenome]|uniref:Type II secretion system protein F n=1 Tax=bioreactor metagenome TaxID=1076179 RepID=A0A644T0J6_9ZZZZ|nr:type II secretion system F family protein [Negativicutes bacterium]
MAKTFFYQAKNRTGQLLIGTILADSENAVANYIRGKGYFVTKIKVQQESLSLKTISDNLTKVTIKDLALLCRQFATMVDAGLSMLSCLNILIEQTYNAKLKAALGQVYKKVQEGNTLSSALNDHPNIFPSLMVSMVEAGELGGVLDNVLNRLAVHFEKEHKMNEKVKSALTYPVVVIGMAMIIVIFILTFILPTFTQMFASMNVQLPPATLALLAVSTFLQDYWPALFVLVIAVTYLLSILSKRPQTKLIIDQAVLKVPIFGMLRRKIAIARFSRTLGTLIRGGVPIISALDVVKKTTTNAGMIQALKAAQTSISEGLGLSTPLGASNIFTAMVVQMVAVGEETGELDKMLDKIADFYESDVDDVVGRLSSLLEPILIAVLGVIIGFMIIAIVLPMFDAVTSIGNM